MFMKKFWQEGIPKGLYPSSSTYTKQIWLKSTSNICLCYSLSYVYEKFQKKNYKNLFISDSLHLINHQRLLQCFPMYRKSCTKSICLCHSLSYVYEKFQKSYKNLFTSDFLHLTNPQRLLQCFPMYREPKVVSNTLF